MKTFLVAFLTAHVALGAGVLPPCESQLPSHSMRMDRMEHPGRMGARAVMRRSGSALAAQTLRLAYEIEGVPRWPDVHVDPLGVGECHFVSAATGNGCDTVCTLGDGGALCETLTDPHTATCLDTPWGKGYYITAASQAPVCDSAVLRAVYADDGGAGPVSTLMLGNVNTSGASHDIDWWMDFFDGTGPNYRQMYNDRSGDESGSAAALWCSPGGSGSTSAPFNLRGGWGVFGCMYTGGSGGSALRIGAQLSTEDTTNVSRGAFHSGTKLTLGANDAHNGTRYALNGTLARYSLWAKQMSADEYTAKVDQAFGYYTDAGHLTPTQLTTVKLDTEDWRAVTGNFETVYTPIGMIDPTLHFGLRTKADLANLAAANALDVASMVDVGVVIVNANTSSGVWANAKHAATVDEVVCAAPGCGKETLEHFNNWDGGYEPSWYYLAANLTAGLTGVERTKATLQIVTDGTILGADGGTGSGGTYSCPVSGLTSTTYAAECVAKITGATTVKGRFIAPAAGSFQLDGPFWITGPHREPPWDTSTQRPSTHISVPVANLPDMSNGVRCEIVFVPPASSNKYTLGFPTNGGTLYLLDMEKSSDHAGCFLIADYPNSDGGAPTLLGGVERGPAANRLEAPGNQLVAGTQYAYAIQADRHLGTCADGGATCCDLRMYFNACSGVGSDGGVACTNPNRTGDAVTLVQSSLDGSKTCPLNPDTVRLGNRFNNVVPTSAAFKSLRISTP